jgi:two-component system cell cycle response regulator DivK
MESKNILIVDDSLANLKLLRLLLAGEGHSVQTATCAEEALAALSLSTPDAILMDVQMPGMSGLDLTRLIKLDSRTSGIRVLAVSANAMEADIQQAREAGCAGYITKPIDTRRFVSTVGEYL